jgi:hypothetical protein
MAVITITINESPIQIVDGIPRTIELETNVPATVFYTLNGTEPTFNSQIAVGPIDMPTDQNTVTLKAFATDGVDTCPTITQGFGPDWEYQRKPRDKVIGLCTQPLPNDGSGFFGTQSPEPNVKYDGIGGITVDSPGVVGIPDGYDGTATGTVAVAPDLEYNRQNYDIEYSTKTETESGPGVGNLPADVTIQIPPPVPGFSDANSKLFDPKALVIIQDGREEPEDPNVSLINRQFFSMADNERIRDGSMYFTTGFEGNAATGSLLRPQYNAVAGTWTFPYRDSETNRWIFSIEPVRKAPRTGAIRQVLLPSSSTGERNVFRWIPFKRSHLR